MANCSSGYEPSGIVETFHDIPHVDIDLGEINSTYEQTVEEYFEAIIVWSCLPILFGIIMVILFFLFWGLLWAYEYCTRTDSTPTYREPSKWVKVLLVVSILSCILLCIGICGATMYIDVTLTDEIHKIRDTASSAETTIDDVGIVASRYNHSEVLDDINILRGELAGSGTGVVPLLDSLAKSSASLQYSYGNINEIPRGYFLDESEDDVEQFELARRISVLVFLSLVVVVFVLFSVVLLFTSPAWITTAAVLVFIFMLLMWCASGAALGAVIVGSDICFNPDETVLTQISSPANRRITEYYMFCHEYCNPENSLVQLVGELPERQEAAENNYTAVDARIPSNYRNATVNASLESLRMILDESSSSAMQLDDLLDCKALSEEYNDARDSFCDEGIIYTLVLFCVTTGLGFMYYIILCLTKKYVNVLYAADRWGKSGFSYQFSSPTPDLQSNGYTNGSANDTHRQTSVRRKQQYDGGWVAGKTHQGNYKHRGSSAEYELQEGPLPEYSDVLNN